MSIMKIVMVLLLLPVILSAENVSFSADDYVTVSGSYSPNVSYAISKEKDGVVVSIQVESYEQNAEDVDVKVGLGAAKAVILESNDAKISRKDGIAAFNFFVPAGLLTDTDSDWKKLRMGLIAKWLTKSRKDYRQIERYMCLDTGSTHAPLPMNSDDWQILDLTEYEAMVKDRKSKIVFSVNQPMDGKLTVVIEDEDGNRIRNLVSGAAKEEGDYVLEWDGLDDDGKIVKQGSYRWRSISHPGITPEYLFSFANGGEKSLRGFGPNHNIFEDAISNSKYVFIAAPSTEGGNSLIAVDDDGMLVHDYQKIHGTGLGAVAVAADETNLYVVYDGPGWGAKIDKKKADWVAEIPFTLAKYNIETGKSIDFPGRERFVKLAEHEYGPGSKQPLSDKYYSLAGMALCNGKLYISSIHAQAILVVDPETGKEVAKIDVPSPGTIASYKSDLYIISGNNLVQFKNAQGTPRTIIKNVKACSGLSIDEQGEFYLSDAESHTVHVFDTYGKKIKTIGEEGGPYEGKYIPERMINPIGICAARGKLWVTERRRNPKRVTGWDLKTDKIVKFKYGNPSYGGPGAGFDFQDHTKWIGLRSGWKLDFKNQTATCTSVLQKSGGHLGGKIPWEIHYRFVHQDDRIFLLGLGKTSVVSELMPDGSVRDLAALSASHQFSYSCGWKPPQAYIDAFNKNFPEKIGKHMDRGPGVLWVDHNGDGLCQENEFDFTHTTEKFAGSGWGHDNYDLNLRVPVTRDDGSRGFVVLKPDGYLKSGAPNYPKLDVAVTNAVIFKDEVANYDYKSIHVETTVDQFGRMIFNTDPKMVGYSETGELLWSYPNRWTNVHGSHKAPLPQVGVMQGTLFFLGVAPFDKDADVFIMNGNHGRFFVLTTDGVYLDEMFKDVRTGGSRDAYWVGGEAFGGFFGKSEADGNYYLQTGGDGYRIFQLNGLDKCVRSDGNIKVTPTHLMAAERKLGRSKVAAAQKKETVISKVEGTVNIDGRYQEWSKSDTVSWDRDGQYNVNVKCSYDKENLYILYRVRDNSPWVNNGKDWTTLFKTGDSIDLQLGTDPNALAHRSSPVPGDMRLLIAPYEGKPIAVLYKHRVPGTKEPFIFSSPWRSENVDVVEKITDAKIAVDVSGDWYVVEAAIPLKNIGLDKIPSEPIKADFGVVYGDPAGTVNVLRSYWANEATGLVNDVPGEIMLNPRLWGTISFQ